MAIVICVLAGVNWERDWTFARGDSSAVVASFQKEGEFDSIKHTQEDPQPYFVLVRAEL